LRKPLVWVVILGAASAVLATEPSRAPVLVELFTSEGCSSCPPADRILEQLDSHAVVLSEHVDYWDHEGWKDRYSSHALTQRQENYARHFGIDGPYTPEMVIDGRAEFNGSDGRRAQAEIAKALEGRKAAIRLSRSAAGIEIAIDDAPHSSAVWLVLAENAADTQVSGGENNGKHLHHVAIVRSLKKIGAVKKNEPFHKVIELPREDAARRLVVFLQDSDSGPVAGAAVLEPHNPAP
jgi:hypothetical protein